MNSAVYSNGSKLRKENFACENDFETEIRENSKKLFGDKTIYLDKKNKIESLSLGGSIPDAILFDFKDQEEVKFYLIEIELARHNFYTHIFPQITKFLAFYKNPVSLNSLIEKIHNFVTTNESIKKEFESLLNGQEIYKSIKDAVENNQKILLILDDKKVEIEEVQRVYTDTWNKLVTSAILSKFSEGEKEVFILEPDFSEEITELKSYEEKESEEDIVYSEGYHLEDVDNTIRYIYERIKQHMLRQNEQLIFNPQKYYISIRGKRNFAYLDIKKRKIKIAVMLPFEKGQEMIKTNKLRKFTEGIQKFYGRPSFEVTIENEENQGEVLDLLVEAYKQDSEKR
ncbi:MAG TPA: DUF5655 domain-containing protein [Candidatus Nanoarchaeia archaeon]|nr:DUF5655 domain-containing protein [Candidatus Nanoarchaeia archaeon]